MVAFPARLCFRHALVSHLILLSPLQNVYPDKHDDVGYEGCSW